MRKTAGTDVGCFLPDGYYMGILYHILYGVVNEVTPNP